MCLCGYWGTIRSNENYPRHLFLLFVLLFWLRKYHPQNSTWIGYRFCPLSMSAMKTSANAYWSFYLNHLSILSLKWLGQKFQGIHFWSRKSSSTFFCYVLLWKMRRRQKICPSKMFARKFQLESTDQINYNTYGSKFQGIYLPQILIQPKWHQNLALPQWFMTIISKMIPTALSCPRLPVV